MPELPDVTIYVERLRARIVGQALERVRLGSPFVLRSVTPPLSAIETRVVRAISRIGKRIVITVDGDRSLVIHLMIAGRLRWREAGASLPRRRGLAAFDFRDGTVLFTEEGTKKRASLHVVGSAAELACHDRGGLEPLEATTAQFREALRRENHTVKRALTDPRLFAGIGNTYSDEILHAAGLSPMKLTHKMSDAEIGRLHGATRATLELWTSRLRASVGQGFPEKVSAFREGMSVHGRYGEPGPVCRAPVQRIVYASNEANYCARCQTGGRLLSDRSLSRLLKSDWPRSLDALEQMTAARQSDVEPAS
jgi:formamidopyrimidine-DNA glycosylase